MLLQKDNQLHVKTWKHIENNKKNYISQTDWHAYDFQASKRFY